MDASKDSGYVSYNKDRDASGDKNYINKDGDASGNIFSRDRDASGILGVAAAKVFEQRLLQEREEMMFHMDEEDELGLAVRPAADASSAGEDTSRDLFDEVASMLVSGDSRGTSPTVSPAFSYDWSPLSSTPKTRPSASSSPIAPPPPPPPPSMATNPLSAAVMAGALRAARQLDREMAVQRAATAFRTTPNKQFEQTCDADLLLALDLVRGAEEKLRREESLFRAFACGLGNNKCATA